VIKILDIRNNKATKLTRKSRYLAASISPDGKKIAAIENTIVNKNSLVLLDPGSGNVLYSVATPGNCSLQYPKWSQNGDKITVISLTEEGEGVMSFTLASQEWHTLVAAGRDDIQATFLRNDSLLYISSASGTDNILLKAADGIVKQLTRSRFGVTDICVSGDKVLFSDYNSLGNNICITFLSDITDSPFKPSNSSSFLINNFDTIPVSSSQSENSDYLPEPYNKWKHLFNFHSWMPFYADLEEIKADPSSVRPGFSLMTQNHLSTLISSVGYEYSENRNHVLHSRITWKGWYPVFDSQLDYGNDAMVYSTGNNGDVATQPSEVLPGIRFSNTVSLPLYFTAGRFTEYFRPSIKYDYMNSYVYNSDRGIYDYGQTILSGRLFFSNFSRYAERDIFPRWAQTLDLNYSFAPFDKEIYGSAVTLKTSLYLPGFLPDNGIKIRYEKEKQYPVRFVYGNRITLPRGYLNLFSEDVDFISLDYVLPLLYPDLSISSLLFLKRIRTGLFYDYASGPGNTFFTSSINGLVAMYNHSDRESFSSSGIELLADFHVFRNPYMISWGVQTAWTELSNKPSVRFLFSVDIFGMSIGRRP